jgi:hypothetical protein
LTLPSNPGAEDTRDRAGAAGQGRARPGDRRPHSQRDPRHPAQERPVGYDSREHLLRAAIESSTAEIVIPTDLPTYDTFRWLLHDAARMAENMVGRGAAASIILNDHPESNELMREMIKARSAKLTAFLHERVKSGDLRADLDIGLAATVLLGALFGQLIRGGELDDAWADSVLELLWPGLRAD